MNKYKILLILGLLMGFGWKALAEPDRIQDVVLSTPDKRCSVHYLTHANTTGWYIGDVAELSCANGAVSGQGQVLLLNAFGKEEERLSGYFNQGYWVGQNPFMLPLKAIYLTDSDSHSLTADFGLEEKSDVHYIARMTATRRSDNSYGPFLGCEPVQVIAVTANEDLFENEKTQQELITSVIQKAESVCPNVSQIYFYGSGLENPQNKDIFFFADINLENGEIKIRRLPNSPRKQDIWHSPEERAPAIPMPTEVRREKAVPIMEVKPIIPEKQNVKKVPAVQVQPIQPPRAPMPIVIQDEALPLITPTPVPQKEEAVEAEETLPLTDFIPNLLTISRLLKQPIAGSALIHISHFDNRGTAIVDEPVPLRVKGSGLSLGWGVAEGDFSYRVQDGGLPEVRGFVQIRSFTPYKIKDK